MKRDLDLIREILLFVEEKSPPGGPCPVVEISGFDKAMTGAHIDLLMEAHLLNAVTPGGRKVAIPPHVVHIYGLSWTGHEFLALAAPRPMWENMKTEALKHGVNLTLDMALSLLKHLAARHLGLP